mgnify:CR=1 FL=1
MKYIVVSDFHADMYTQYAEPIGDEPYNTRFQHQLNTLSTIYKLALKYHAKVIFNGDLFNSRVNIDQVVYSNIVNTIVDEANLLSTDKSIHGPSTLLLAGNHDQYDNSRIPANSLAMFKNFENCRVITTPSEFQSEDDDLVFLPYSEDTDWLKEELDKIVSQKHSTNSYLFAHVGVSGAVQGKWNHRLGGAFSINELHPEYFKQIILGHYHLRQSLATGTDCKAYYVGNTVPLNHNDDGQKKGVYLVDTKANSAKFIEIQNPMFMTLDAEKHSEADIKEASKTNYIKIVTHSKESLDTFKDESALVSYEPEKDETTSDLGIKMDDSVSKIVKAYTEKYYPQRTDLALKVLNKAQEGDS